MGILFKDGSCHVPHVDQLHTVALVLRQGQRLLAEALPIVEPEVGVLARVGGPLVLTGDIRKFRTKRNDYIVRSQNFSRKLQFKGLILSRRARSCFYSVFAIILSFLPKAQIGFGYFLSNFALFSSLRLPLDETDHNSQFSAFASKKYIHCHTFLIIHG